MKLRTTEQLRGNTLIVRLRGRLAAGPTEIRMWDDVRRMLACGHRKILLDLAQASGGDASVISTLLGALFLAQADGGTVKLLHVTRGFDDLQIIVALYEHFDCYESERAALESYAESTVAVHPAVFARMVPEAEVA